MDFLKSMDGNGKESHIHLSIPQNELSPAAWALTTLFSGLQRVRPSKGKDHMMVEGVSYLFLDYMIIFSCFQEYPDLRTLSFCLSECV